VERVIWSTVLVLVCVASVIMLTWQEFAVAVMVGVPCLMIATRARRAITGALNESKGSGEGVP
jgi:hypothetical protein